MHEAIISKEDFERAKKIINATKGSRVVQNDYLFKGLLRCYDCKGYIGIRSPDKNGNIYGRCQRYGRFGKFDICSPHNFNYKVFEEQMLEVLREVCKEYGNVLIAMTGTFLFLAVAETFILGKNGVIALLIRTYMGG